MSNVIVKQSLYLSVGFDSSRAVLSAACVVQRAKWFYCGSSTARSPARGRSVRPAYNHVIESRVTGSRTAGKDVRHVVLYAIHGLILEYF